MASVDVNCRECWRLWKNEREAVPLEKGSDTYLWPVVVSEKVALTWLGFHHLQQKMGI